MKNEDFRDPLLRASLEVQVDGLPHDDELVTNNINDFDLSLDEIEKLDAEIRKALLE